MLVHWWPREQCIPWQGTDGLCDTPLTSQDQHAEEWTRDSPAFCDESDSVTQDWSTHTHFTFNIHVPKLWETPRSKLSTCK